MYARVTWLTSCNVWNRVHYIVFYRVQHYEVPEAVVPSDHVTINEAFYVSENKYHNCSNV